MTLTNADRLQEIDQAIATYPLPHEWDYREGRRFLLDSIRFLLAGIHKLVAEKTELERSLAYYREQSEGLTAGVERATRIIVTLRSEKASG